jgi:CSLREA domain-containing protein
VPANAALGTTITVNSLADTTGSPACTLRDAITSADTDSATGGCPAGVSTGPDAIVFSVSGAILLGAALPTINSDMSIDGSGQSVTIDGQKLVRAFWVLGGAVSFSTIMITNVDATNSDGAGFEIASGTVGISNVVVSNAHAQNDAGVRNSQGTVTIDNSTFTDNVSNNAAAAIGNYAAMTVRSSTFIGNTAYYAGGAIENGGTMTVANSTFYGNTGQDEGGALANVGGELTILNSTISGGSAAYGSALVNVSSLGHVTIKNSIFAGSAPLCYNTGAALLVTSSVTQDTSCVGFTKITAAHLALGSLGINGGATETIPLLPWSTAINAGNNTVCAGSDVSAVDQRGVARPMGPNCDLGAFELVYRPDALIKLASDTSFVGSAVYSSTAAGQTRTVTIARGSTATFTLRFLNHGYASDRVRVSGCGSTTGLTTTYLSGTTNVTSGVTGGTFKTNNLTPNSFQNLTLKATLGSGVASGQSFDCKVTGFSGHQTGAKDVVDAVITAS